MDSKLKYLRTDSGLEFLSKELTDFYKEKGIPRHRTVKHTPQQSFWGEVITAAAYLINRSPSSAIGFNTPMEMWSGKAADYSNLRIFGCLAYAHIKQDKLEARALKCTFIG